MKGTVIIIIISRTQFYYGPNPHIIKNYKKISLKEQVWQSQEGEEQLVG